MFASVARRVSLFVCIVAPLKHVRLVNISAYVNVFVAHYFSKVVTMGPWSHFLG